MLKIFKRIVLGIILFSITAFTATYILVLYYGNSSEPQKSDVIVVLGCQIWGRYPGWSLEYRLQEALEQYNNKKAGYIIVSGGQGIDEETTEASVMKAWLVNHGIDKKRILLEDKSTSTYENIKLSKAIMDKYNFKSAVIVSSDFHIFRSTGLAGRLGIKASGAPAPTVSRLKLYYQVREVFSIMKSFIFDW